MEARLTAQDIYNFYNNIRVNNKGNDILISAKQTDFDEMRKFFKRVDAHIGKKILDYSKHEKEDKQYWSKLIVGYSQLRGLKNGYNFEMSRLGHNNKKLEIEDFLIIQSDGEIPELLSIILVKKDISVMPGLNSKLKITNLIWETLITLRM